VLVSSGIVLCCWHNREDINPRERATVLRYTYTACLVFERWWTFSFLTRK